MSAIPARKLRALANEARRMRQPHVGLVDVDGEDDAPGSGSPQSRQAPPPVVSPDRLAEMVLDASDRVGDGDGDADLMDAVDGYDPGEGGGPPSWVADQGRWGQALAAARDCWADLDHPWAVVAHVYRELGGGLR
jgi:hypothetical protein